MNKHMDKKTRYGLGSVEHARDLALWVCNVLGHGTTESAVQMLLETAAAETNLGHTLDIYAPEGFGLCQFDTIAFNDVIERTSFKTKTVIRQRFGYILNRVSAEDLTNDPLLSFIFCRLKYRLRPEQIPTTLEGRARYWKQFYNTHLGKGTVSHYIKTAKHHLYQTEYTEG